MDIAIVYMVAGLSSRFGGKVKQFAKVGPNEETLIEYSLNQALKAGFTKIIFIVGNKTEQPFKEMFGNSYNNIPIYYAKQEFNPEKRDKPWGTLDALCSAKEIIDCPFIICNGDDIYGENTFRILVEHLKNKQGCASIGYKLKEVIPKKGSVNRGIFQVKNNFINSIKEVFDITYENLLLKNLSEEDLCSMNIFLLYPEILVEFEKILIEFKKNYQDDRKIECLLPQEISNLIKQEKIVMEIYPTDDKCLGGTNPEDEEIIREKLKLDI
jgi:choline kinase